VNELHEKQLKSIDGAAAREKELHENRLKKIDAQ
jgi:hypothetical protein